MHKEPSLTEMIDTMEDAYEAFLSLARAYPAGLRTRSGACGEWSAQQVLAHLCGWFAEGQRRYRAFGRGTGDMQYNIDAFNRVSLWQRRSMTYDELIAELERRMRGFVQAARGLTPQQIEREERYVQWLHSMTREARLHADQLRAFHEAHA